MLKKTITYKDFNDVEQTGDFYFNLTKAEAVLLEVGRDGGKTLSDSLQELIDARSNKTLVKEFKDIIRLAYGERSVDGKRFEKGDEQELAKKFESTGAYHTLLLELVTDAGAAIHFINGIVPEEMASDPNAILEQSSQLTPRQLSEQRMTGYQKKQKVEPQSSTSIVPDLPTTYGEAEPKKEDVPVGASVGPVAVNDLNTPGAIAQAPVSVYGENGQTITNYNPEIQVTPEQEQLTRRAALAAQQNLYGHQQ